MLLLKGKHSKGLYFYVQEFMSSRGEGGKYCDLCNIFSNVGEGDFWVTDKLHFSGK